MTQPPDPQIITPSLISVLLGKHWSQRGWRWEVYNHWSRDSGNWAFISLSFHLNPMTAVMILLWGEYKRLSWFEENVSEETLWGEQQCHYAGVFFSSWVCHDMSMRVVCHHCKVCSWRHLPQKELPQRRFLSTLPVVRFLPACKKMISPR